VVYAVFISFPSTHPVKYMMYLKGYLKDVPSFVAAATAEAIVRAKHSHTRVMAAIMLVVFERLFV
jgi:hypothetical protein